MKRGKGNLIGYIWLRNWFLKYVIEGKIEGRIEVTGRRGRRRNQLLDDLKGEKTGYWKQRKHKIVLCGQFAAEGAISLL